jgi:hypothetical protein
MPEPSAHRTLVKSPPELWAELSDVESLARHLGEFGEIRITRLDPETTVAWEGDRARGTVELEPSGWGTKVTITAELPESKAEPLAAEPEPEPPAAGADHGVEPLSERHPEPLATEPELLPTEPESEPLAGEAKPEPPAESDPDPEPLAAEPEPDPEPLAAEPEPVAAEPEPPAEPEPAPLAVERKPAPKKGFFARLFGRRRKVEAIVESEAAEREPEAVKTELEAVEPEPVAGGPEPVAVEPEPEPAAVEPEPESKPIAVAEPPPEPEVVEPQPGATPVLDDERVHAILTGVLDDLGSAHHRPFSRS